ncbi:hypothetical protein B0H13DRAFT_2357492 [Mycena leptocephala]|nr:hypothetical protein B0H13DRAFT_2357492 [Mycena leptocephala]
MLLHAVETVDSGDRPSAKTEGVVITGSAMIEDLISLSNNSFSDDSDTASDDCDCPTPQEESKALVQQICGPAGIGGSGKPPIISFGLASRLRGGGSTDDSSSEADSDAPNSDSDSEQGIRGGMFVDEIIHLDSAPELWNIPASTHRIAYLLDLTDRPELLGVGRSLTLDGYVKKQDAWTGPTGSTSARNLAKVVLFDLDAPPVLCRRSNLTCVGCYTCSLAADNFLDACQRWDDTDEPHENVSAHIRAAKVSESESVVAVASAFYRSAKMAYCKGKFLDSNAACGGYAILRKSRDGKQKGKTYFVGCSNWADGDSGGMSKFHRFTAIPSSVRESVLVKLFKGEPIDEADDDTNVLAGSCCHIVHPSHLPQNSMCPRNHFQEGMHVVAKLQKHLCSARLSILIPIDGSLRAVVIPGAGIPHTHPSFPRTKVPAAVIQKYKKCIEATGSIGITTLRVDKAHSTLEILGGKLPQEVHPGMINSRKRRDIVHTDRITKFPEGTGLQGVYHELENDKSRDIKERYVHSATTRTDGTHVIITINPQVAELTLEAIWIMVDTTFAVVHGKTNEWKLIIWLNSLDKRIVIGRVWSNRATREAFVLVWNGIFEAIATITGKDLNFRAFSSKSKLLGAIGDSEGAQAQGLGDVIILRRMNSATGVGSEVDLILMLIWKTCTVHFNRGVLALMAYISDNDLQYLLGFPYLVSSEELEQYYTFCRDSSIVQVQNWWAHKLGYPWLLPSLNRELSHMDKRYWDLTPSDTNPIEGSHAQDNQVNSTNRSLLEAILLAKQLDSETARVIMATLTFGVLENPNYSLQARFRRKAQRDARSREKQTELQSVTGKEAKKLRGEVKTGKQQLKEKDLEIATLRRKVQFLTESQPAAVASPIYVSDDEANMGGWSSDPSQMAALDLFPGIHPMTPIPEPRSDFDYPGALNSDIMDKTLKAIVKDHPMYPIDGDEDILASDIYRV